MKLRFVLSTCASLGALALLAAPAIAQHRDIPFNNGIPVAPSGLEGKPLPKLPLEFDTGEGMRIRVSAVATGLNYPWSMQFLPDGSILITERTAHIRRILPNGKLDPNPVEGAPTGYGEGQSGLPGATHGYMDLALHPDFASNHLIYLTYNKPGREATDRILTLARGRWDGEKFVDMEDIFTTGKPGTSRIAFDRDGKLYLTTTSGAGDDPQTLDNLGGKVLRLNDDGSVPGDNPFVGQPGARPEIFTLGHRNQLGLAMHPVTGEMWTSENGPNGGDEINILKAGANYGWPVVSYGRTYQGPWQNSPPGHDGFEAPVVFWMPAIAVSGLTFYTGDALPKWTGDVFVGGMRTGEIPGTGHLERILFNAEMQELRREALLSELRQRIREVEQGPNGLLYVLTDEEDGALLKIEPAN